MFSLFSFRIEFLRHLKSFFQVMFKIETKPCGEELKGGDKVLMTCVGIGFSNLSKTLKWYSYTSSLRCGWMKQKLRRSEGTTSRCVHPGQDSLLTLRTLVFHWKYWCANKRRFYHVTSSCFSSDSDISWRPSSCELPNSSGGGALRKWSRC